MKKVCYNREVPITRYTDTCPWHSWIARQTPTLKVEGSNPFGQARKKHLRKQVLFSTKFALRASEIASL